MADKCNIHGQQKRSTCGQMSKHACPGWSMLQHPPSSGKIGEVILSILIIGRRKFNLQASWEPVNPHVARVATWREPASCSHDLFTRAAMQHVMSFC